MNVIEIAQKLMGNANYPIVTYDIDISESDYDSKSGVIRLGTMLKDDYRDYAIIAEEIAHAEQDKDGYWAMRLAQWRILPGIAWFFVERDAKERAMNLLWLSETCLVKELTSIDVYYKATLKDYRKQTFGI